MAESSNAELYYGKIGKEMQIEHHDLDCDGKYQESHFQEAIEHVLIKNRVKYKTEYCVNSNNTDGRRRRMDIYLPETDTAIELKLKANIRGLGQCVKYANHHNEAVLLTAEHSAEVCEEMKQMNNCIYSVCTPGVHLPQPMFDFSNTTKEADFMREYEDISAVKMAE